MELILIIFNGLPWLILLWLAMADYIRPIYIEPTFKTEPYKPILMEFVLKDIDDCVNEKEDNTYRCVWIK